MERPHERQIFPPPLLVAIATAAATLITLAGCGPAEDWPNPETETAEQENSAGGADPSDGDEDEVRIGAEGFHGSAEHRALGFIHVVEPERPVDAAGEMRLPSADLAEIVEDAGGVAEESSPGSDPAFCENDLR